MHGAERIHVELNIQRKYHNDHSLLLHDFHLFITEFSSRLIKENPCLCSFLMNEMLTLDQVPIEANIYVFFALMCLNLPLHPSRVAGGGWGWITP